jgi:flagellar biosynthesis/type III secretory pathway M-ring protein FliF/YscJ
LLPPQKREGFFGALTTAGKIGLAVLAVLVIAAIVLLVLFAN